MSLLPVFFKIPSQISLIWDSLAAHSSLQALLENRKTEASCHSKKEASSIIGTRLLYTVFRFVCTRGGNRTHTPERTGF